MLLVTPLKVLYVDCTEVSATFNEAPVENMKVSRLKVILKRIFNECPFAVLRRSDALDTKYSWVCDES